MTCTLQGNLAETGTFQDALHDSGLRPRVILVVCFALKGVCTAQHGEQHDAHAPDVRQLGIILP